MIVDGRQLTESDTLEADVCIIGAGAAAISIALAFVDSPVRVLVLESGGSSDDPGGRYLYRVLANSPHGVTVDRRKPWYFGGATNHWFGNCRPLHDGDFAPRDWVPFSRWPIGPRELLPFYELAQRLCRLGDFDTYRLEACLPHLASPPVAVESSILTNRVLQTASALRLGELYRERLATAANVQVCLHTRALRLETTARGDAVDAVVATSSEGHRHRVRAGAFILAAGGIENARLLLCSDRPNGRGGGRGLGNDYDVVGRYFMEHAFVDIPFGPWKLPGDLGFYIDRQDVGAAVVWGQLTLSDEVVARERLPGLSLWFYRTTPLVQTLAIGGRVRDLVLRREQLPRPLAEARSAMVDIGAMVRGVGREVVGLARPRPGSEGFGLRVCPEQVPDPDNRITLGQRRDRLGERQVRIAFRLTRAEEHARSLRIAADELGLDGKRMAARFLSRLRAGRMGFYSHHTGATRMHRDPTLGVVDADCRVHGIDNLFVAGSSVFPTSGTAAPTLTIVALALRLAEHVRSRYA